MYHALYVITFGDILITEIMADPTPGIDLPEYEYLEIHNPHSEVFNLNEISLIVGNDTTTIPEISIHTHEYIILCQSSAVEHFLNYGRTIKVTNWPSLNNRGELILLLNKNEELVFSVDYDNTWYKSIDKDDGGYSLEMIDVDFPCKGQENWIASEDPTGGTPGKENSIEAKLTDLTGPEIERIIADSDTTLKIYLNENIGPQEIGSDNISIQPSLVISKVHLKIPTFKEIDILLNTAVNPRTLYELKIENISDCAGNIQKETASTFVLPEVADSLDLIINEILFNPWPNGVDFVEIYNQSEKYIDLNTIYMENNDSKPITEDHFIIEPSQYIAITEDPTTLNNHYPGIKIENILITMDLPAFSDDEGNAIISNSEGEQIDFFHYDVDFHSSFLNDTEGVSLERISFEGPTNNLTIGSLQQVLLAMRHQEKLTLNIFLLDLEMKK